MRLILVGIFLAAFGLRLAYALHISPYSDEYITMLAARGVLRCGRPILPSGFFYDHGIAFVYLDALFLALLGFTREAARTASVFVGILMLALLYDVGRRWFSPRVGLLAALLLALTPDAIVWHGRARMYSLLQLTFCAGVFWLYEGFIQRDSRLTRCAGIGAMAVAVLAHMLAVPYLMVTLAALALVYGWRHRCGTGIALRIRALWPELLTAILGLGVVLLTRLWGGAHWNPGGYVVTDAALLFDVTERLYRFLGWLRAFLVWPNLLWAVIVLTGMLVILLRARRRQSRAGDGAMAFLFLIWLGTVAGLSIFVIWYADSYVFALLPLFFLLSARALDEWVVLVVRAFGDRRARRAAAMGGTTLAVGLIVLLLGGRVRHTMTHDPLQLDAALAYVRHHRRAGDIVVAFAPHAALIEVGQVDFYGQEMGAPTVETTRGRVDVWTGAPVLDSVSKLKKTWRGEGRMWLIVHRENWPRHYSVAYRAWVDSHMRRVFEGTGTWVYRER